MRNTQRERQRHRQREKQAPCREPDVGLDPGTPESLPGLKAGAKPLSHPGNPSSSFISCNVSDMLVLKLFSYLFSAAQVPSETLYKSCIFKNILFVYSWETQREREAEIQAEGEAGSMQGAWYGTRSRVCRIMPWAEGRHQITELPGLPKAIFHPGYNF